MQDEVPVAGGMTNQEDCLRINLVDDEVGRSRNPEEQGTMEQGIQNRQNIRSVSSHSQDRSGQDGTLSHEVNQEELVEDQGSHMTRQPASAQQGSVESSTVSASGETVWQGDPGRMHDSEDKEEGEKDKKRALHQIHGYQIRIQSHNIKTQAYIDSGSTANFISASLAQRMNIAVSAEGPDFQLADGSTMKMQGKLDKFKFSSGSMKFEEPVYIFPGLAHEVLLGTPWLQKHNPSIDWTTGEISVQTGAKEEVLPVKNITEENKSNMEICSIRQIMKILAEEEGAQMVMAVVQPRTETEAATGEMEELIRSDMPMEAQEMLRSYADVMKSELPGGAVPVRKGVHEFRIELEPGTQPINRPIYKLSPAELEEVRTQVDYLLEKDLIRPSESPWGAPILFVPKKDGKLRMCLDYRWLNDKTIKNRYPLPLPEEMIDRLSGAGVFSKIDLTSGYWQMPVRQEDQEKTAFRTRYGHYEFKVVPFGLTNAPPQFMAMINDIFRDMLDKFVLVFLDDILIYSKDLSEHQQHVEKVLQKMREHRLYGKPSKCLMFVEELDFVGYWISKDGIRPHRSKVQAVRDWVTPATVTEVRSFIGMVSYYRKFIRRFSDVAAPLHHLTKKGVPWSWGPDQEHAFQKLKTLLTEAPILLIPDSSKKYFVVTDASDMALGAVLMQESGEGMKPIAFISRTLRPTEKKYAPYDKEMIAITWALEQWRHYLEGAPGGVEVWTDHLPATYIMKQTNLSRTQVRYLKTGHMQSIKPTFKYIKGRENVVADALSRKREVCAISSAQVSTDLISSWIRGLEEDPKTSSLMSRLRKAERVQGYSLNHEGRLRKHFPDGPDLDVVPQSMREAILREHHDIPISGHIGVARTQEAIRRNYWWQGWKETVREYVSTCPVCQKMKNETGKERGLLQPLPYPSRKWQQVTTDLVTDLPPSDEYTAVAVFVDRMTKYCIFVPCKKTVNAQQYAAMFFENVFSKFGMPETIISDRDPRFTGHFWTELFRILGTRLSFSTAYHPQTDGQSEVTIRTLENFLRPYVEDHPKAWRKYLKHAEFAANNAPSASTGYTPAYMMYGQHPRTIDIFQQKTEAPTAAEELQNNQRMMETATRRYSEAVRRMTVAANKKRKNEEFEEGQLVLLKTRHLPIKNLQQIPPKIRRKFAGPFKIGLKISSVAYRLELPEGWRIHPTFHISKLKPWKESEEFRQAEEQPAAAAEEDVLSAEVEYEVEQILSSEVRGKKTWYLVKWADYPTCDNTWEPEEHLTNAAQKLEAFKKSKQ